MSAPATARGRPLRFLVTLLGLWTAARVAQHWPESPPLPHLATAIEAATIPAQLAAAPAATPAAPEGSGVATVASVTRVAPPASRPPRSQPQPETVAAALRPYLIASQASVGVDTATVIPTTPAPLRPTPSRLAGSAWMIVRGSGNATPFAPQLGGSQAGVRLTYAITANRRLAVTGRFSTALASRQREAAIGLDWQPTALPIHIVAEQRIGIEQARGGPSLNVIGGFGPTPIAGRLQLDAYAQGGAIARNGVEGFIDGAVRLNHPVATLGSARLDLGLGAWGGAQRGASRLDAGPSASLALPVAGQNLRLSLDWRQRLAGRAAPSSGLAFSIGTDF